MCYGGCPCKRCNPEQPAMTDYEQRAEHITGPCRCHEGYKCRQKIDPDCTYHGYAEDIAQALTQAHAQGRREGLDKCMEIVQTCGSEWYEDGLETMSDAATKIYESIAKEAGQ